MACLLHVDTSDELPLSAADFPSGWVHMAHPEDYVEIAEPVPLTIFYHVKPHHNRTLLRVSFKIGEGRYLPVSFVVDTGAPSGMYLSTIARAKLEACGRVVVDDPDSEFVEIPGLGKTCIQDTSALHQPANLIGLPLIRKLSIHFGADVPVVSAALVHF